MMSVLRNGFQLNGRAVMHLVWAFGLEYEDVAGRKEVGEGRVRVYIYIHHPHPHQIPREQLWVYSKDVSRAWNYEPSLSLLFALSSPLLVHSSGTGGIYQPGRLSYREGKEGPNHDRKLFFFGREGETTYWIRRLSRCSSSWCVPMQRFLTPQKSFSIIKAKVAF